MKRIIPNRWAYFLLVTLLLPQPAFSQFEFEEEEFFLAGEWVETAAKRLQPIEESPAAVTIITAEEIKNSGATSFCDLLQRVPGFEVMRVTSGDCEIGARGFNKTLSNGILLLVNGRAVYETFFGVVLWNTKDFALEMIERIEVVRGPGSVLYGANAFHAVVNIITRRPEDIQDNLMSLTAGLDTIVGTALGSSRSGKTSFLVSAGYTQFASYEDSEDITTFYPRARGGFTYDLGERGKIHGEAGVQGGEQQILYELLGKADALYVDHNFMMKYELPKFYFRAFWNSFYVGYAEFNELTFDQMEAFGFVVTVPEDFVIDLNIKSDILDFEAQQILDLGWGNLFTVGASYRFKATRYQILSVHDYLTDNLYAAYVQHEFSWEKYLHTYAGVRWDHHPLTGDTFSPRGSMLISPLAGHTLRLSVGQSFRNPTFVESSMDMSVPMDIGGITTTNVLIQSNPDIGPEELLSYEIGYQANLLQKKIRLGVNVFYNQISDMIFADLPLDIEAALQGELPGGFGNLVDKEARGVEAEVMYQPGDRISGFANYTWTEVEDLTYDRPDDTTPAHKVNAGVTLRPVSGLTSTFLVHYVGETDWPPVMRSPDSDESFWFLSLGELDPYILLNARVAYSFFENRAEAGVNVFNLLNQEHREFPVYGEEVGMKITGSIRISF